MKLKVGDRLPEAVFLDASSGQPVEMPSAEVFAGRAAVFAMPGAFTKTCDGVHLPGLVRAADAFRAEGIDRIVVISVNDPFVMDAWGEGSGAKEAGIMLLADADGSFTRAVGMDFDRPAAGFFGRSHRYGMLVEDGVVTWLAAEENPAECSLTAADAALDAIRGRKASAAT